MIDCEDPTRGLKPSAKFDPNAVMSYSEKLVNNELTNDDLGGRNFLYPICLSASADATARTTETTEAATKRTETALLP